MSTTSVSPDMIPAVVLEPAAQAVADALAAGGGPPLYTLAPKDARAVLDQAQAGDVALAPAMIEERTIPVGPSGQVAITIVRPAGATELLPVVVYVHGGGWVFGNSPPTSASSANWRGRPARRSSSSNYTPSPEAHYPAAIEEGYAAMRWVAERGAAGLDGTRMAIAGDSVGGNMAAAVTLMAKERGGPASAIRSSSTRSPMPPSTPTPTSSSPRATG